MKVVGGVSLVLPSVAKLCVMEVFSGENAPKYIYLVLPQNALGGVGAWLWLWLAGAWVVALGECQL